MKFAADSVEKRAHYLLRDVGKAMRDFGMVAEGDRVAVAVSGGKDSLALLELLDRQRRTWPVRFEVAAIHVRGDATGVTGAREPGAIGNRHSAALPDNQGRNRTQMTQIGWICRILGKDHVDLSRSASSASYLRSGTKPDG